MSDTHGKLIELLGSEERVQEMLDALRTERLAEIFARYVLPSPIATIPLRELGAQVAEQLLDLVAFRDPLSPDEFEILYQEGHASLKPAMARNEHLPKHLQEQLLASSSVEILEALGMSHFLSSEQQEYLFDKGIVKVHQALALGVPCRSVLLKLSKSEDESTLNLLAGQQARRLATSDAEIGVPYWRNNRDESLEEALRLAGVPLEEGLSLASSWQGSVRELKEALALTFR